MSGGSDFEMAKLELHNALNALMGLTLNKETVIQIRKIQMIIAQLQE